MMTFKQTFQEISPKTPIRQRLSYAETAEKVFQGNYPDILCILGRGIERWQYMRGNEIVTSDKWRPTPLFERVQMPSRSHTGFGEYNLDLTDNNVRVGGANANVHAAYIALRGLAEIGKTPKSVGVAAGRPKYLQEQNPDATLSEGKIMSEKLMRKLRRTLCSPLVFPQENPLYEVRVALANPELPHDRNTDLVLMPYNTNSEDDLRASLYIANKHGARTLRFISVGVHVPRCETFLNIVKKEKPEWESIDAKFISADHILGTFRPAYKMVARSLESIPAFANTCVDEIVGARKKIDGDYTSMQPNPLFQ